MSAPTPATDRRTDPLPRPRSVVVVGGGLAAAATVGALRAQGYDGTVTVLAGEAVPAYDRPPLSKELLTRTEPVWLDADLGLDLAGADVLRLATPVTGLRATTEDVTVTTADDTVTADVAVLATGAHAVRPAGWESALTLHTAADAAALRSRLRPGARLVVVGAGWIGAEVAGVAAATGVDVTVVEAADAPLAAALGTAVGALTAPWYAAAGVRLLTGTAVTAVQPEGVALEDGRLLDADVVLVAVGARPASAWLDGALAREADGALLVDDAYRVLDAPEPARVLAVGDLARRWSPRHGWVPGGHWDGALRAPSVAARRLLGSPPQPGDDLAPYVFSTQLGHDVALLGAPSTDDDAVLRGDGSAGALWFRPGTERLSAVLVVDRPRDVSAARKLFSGPELPTVDRARAADPAVALRDLRR